MSEKAPEGEEYPIVPTPENVSLPLPVNRTSFLGKASPEDLEGYRNLQVQISRQMIPESSTSTDPLPNWAKPLHAEKQKDYCEKEQRVNIQREKQDYLQSQQNINKTFHQQTEKFEEKKQSLNSKVSEFHFPFEEQKKTIHKRSRSVQEEYEKTQRIIKNLGNLF